MLFAPDISIAINTVLGGKLDRVIFRLETAARLYGWISEDGYPITFYHNMENFINSKYMVGTYVENLDNIETTVVAGYRCTTKEKTICDMFINGCYDQSICESIFYYNEENGLKPIFEYADKLVIRDKLAEYIESYGALETFNEG